MIFPDRKDANFTENFTTMTINRLYYLFFAFILLQACNIEPVDNPGTQENPEEETEEPNDKTHRVKEAIGYSNGTEVAKQSFEYVENKLLSIKVYSKSGNDWVEKVSFIFSYDGNKVTETYDGGRVDYIVNNNKLASVKYIDFSDPVLDSGYNVSFSNEELSSYTYFEGTLTEGTWNYTTNLIYNSKNKLIELENERNTPSDLNYIPDYKTIFSYTGNKISEWETDYSIAPDGDENYNQKIEFIYTENDLSQIIEKSWDSGVSNWETIAEINYNYNSNGYLSSQKYNEIGSDLTDNHLYDYFYFWEDSLDFNEVKYSYEEGNSNNYILLYPEFLAHKTPNPFVKF